ncbi:helix-turn-helix domain-containing protein [Desulfovibrio sp. 6_1_46AFAA]|uniref:helix-turn-helix domain-containing protein n=1 Tax=Desulfovibrio sp. 6_1_46AFAA TaxID=665942 RepID=UPI000A0425B8
MPALPGYYTTTEAAERLGYRTGDALRMKCAAGEIPAYKVGKTWLIPEAWVEDAERETISGKGERGKPRK